MYYMNDKPLQYLLDSVSTTSGRNVQTGTKVNTQSTTRTVTGGVPLPGVPLPLKKKVEETGKQMIEKKPTDQSVYNVSTREKDVIVFDPKQKTIDGSVGQKDKELIPGVPNTYTYIGGGILGLSLLYMLLKD